MSDWNDKSDFEVNKRVAELELGEKWWWKYSTVLTEKLAPTDSGGFEVRKVATDYCKNWSDIGPLIESNQIDVGFIDGFGWTAEHRGQHVVSVYDNPKRAAAICIIKLLESQQRTTNQ